MRSPETAASRTVSSRGFGAWAVLLKKEFRELWTSRAWWFLLLVMGPLTGIAFISAVRTYAEASGLGGTAAGVGEAFSPLVGIWGPTFSAGELAAVFLFPFVVIRLAGTDFQSGAFKIEVQHPLPELSKVRAKALIALVAWLIASLPFAIAVGLWRIYGGHIYWPELASVFAGHMLNALLTIAVALAAATLAKHPSTAAIVTLGITVGTWIVHFIAAIHGGVWAKLAEFTPTALAADFQHGLIKLSAILFVLLFTQAMGILAAIWRNAWKPTKRKVVESAVLFGVICVLMIISARSQASWDVSENRMNSFSVADEAALRSIQQPVRIEVHLAREDPRRVDFERRVTAKLERTVRDFQVSYISQTSIGLFEQSNEHYGEIWYDIGGKRAMSRAVTPELALENIFELAGVQPGASEVEFRGYPLTAEPRFAAIIFYGIWPALVALAFWWKWRRA